MPSSAAPVRCLLIDDNAFDAERLTRELRGLTFPVELSVATTCTGARHALSETRYEILIVDYALPDGDGIELATWIERNGGPNRDTPRILMSGVDDPDLRKKARDAGYSTFLTKGHLTLARLELAFAPIVGPVD